MNIIKHFEKLIESWNDEKKCNYCWKFIGAGRPDLFNMYQDNEEVIKDNEDINENVEDYKCCIHAGLFNIKFGTKYKLDSDGFTKKDHCYLAFEGFVGVPSRLDIQFYNELGNTEQEKEESKWTILNSLKECFGCDFLEILCDGNGFYYPSEFEARQKINYQDTNYDGWWISGRYTY